MQGIVDRQHRRPARWLLLAGGMTAMAVAALAGGCDNRSSDNPSVGVVRPGSASPGLAAGTQVERSAGSQASQAGSQWSARAAGTQATQPMAAAVRDYVLRPQVEAAERDAGPLRIISMAPALTEICWALGLGDRMVGRTQYCIYPPAAQRIEAVGALLDPNIERILSLQPDLVVITRGSPALKEKLEGLDLPLRILPTDSLEDIYTSIERLGEMTGRPKTAALLVRNLRADLGRLKQRASQAARVRPQKVLFVTGALPSPPKGVWVAGPGSYLDALLGLAGATSVVAGDRAWLEIGTEQVLWLRPETIVEVREPAEMQGQAEAAAAWRALPGLSAVRIVTLADIGVVFPGPRVNVMLGKLIDGLYGKDAG